MSIKTHVFNGRKYKITVSDSIDGLCDTYKKERELCIYVPLNSKNGLITAIHEALHAESWNTKEKMVDRVSKEIGTFLWRLGYRMKG